MEGDIVGNDSIIEQTFVEEQLKKINKKINERKQEEQAQKMSDTKQKFMASVLPAMEGMLEKKISLSTENLIALDKKFSSSFLLYLKVLSFLFGVKLGLAVSIFCMIIVAVIGFVLNGAVPWSIIVGWIVIYVSGSMFHYQTCDVCSQFCDDDDDNVHECPVVGYWYYRRKLVKLCGEKAVEETIREKYEKTAVG